MVSRKWNRKTNMYDIKVPSGSSTSYWNGEAAWIIASSPSRTLSKAPSWNPIVSFTTPPRGELNETHLGDIRDDDELELVTVLSEEFLEVNLLRLRPDGSSDGVALLEKEVHDMNGSETVRAGDEDFTSWSDNWHIYWLFEVGMRARFRNLGDGLLREQINDPALLYPEIHYPA